MKRALYNLLFAVVYPFLLPGFLVRMFRRGGYAARMGDRFALYPDDVRAALSAPGSPFVWVHAVSVGEVQVAGQLMREWRKVEPGVRFCFSTTSSTGWKMAGREVTAADVLVYNPLDFPSFVKSALKTVRPLAVVLTESEIWPNFIWAARRLRIPVFLVNARVSDRSAPRYRAARWFFGDVLSSFSRIFAQSGLDAERLRAAGAPADVVEVAGSFKFDVARRDEQKERELREWIGPGRLLVGGSTWPGEDEVMLRVYRSVLDLGLRPPPRLVLAPRHFEKADAVEANVRKAGFACVRRSRGERGEGVLLADTTGELMGLYGIADAVFVGKSLCEHGSQNMIEPCLCGKPVAVGPYTENFRPVMSDLKASDAIVQVGSESELVAFFRRVFAEGDGGLGARAAAAVADRRGVVPRCVSAIRGALCCLVLLACFAGCDRKEEAPAVELEERDFRPVRIVTACIAVIEKPTAVRSLMADDKAAAYCPLFDALGCPSVSNAVGTAGMKYDIVMLAGRAGKKELKDAYAQVGESGLLVWRLDVRGLKASDFKSAIAAFPCPEAHLWMPSREEWVIVGRRSPRQIKLDAMMDVFSRDSAFAVLAESKTTALSDLFANYVGRLSELGDAFDAPDLSVQVRPEFFVSRDVAAVDWIVPGEVDDDICRETLAEIRSMQVVRRLVIEGDLLAEAGKSDEATDVWSRARQRNPRDPMLLDRLDRLNRNAGALLRIGNVAAAAKCFETMIVIDPTDASAVFNYGICLRRLGKKEMSNQVLERAKELRK